MLVVGVFFLGRNEKTDGGDWPRHRDIVRGRDIPWRGGHREVVDGARAGKRKVRGKEE